MTEQIHFDDQKLLINDVAYETPESYAENKKFLTETMWASWSPTTTDLQKIKQYFAIGWTPAEIQYEITKKYAQSCEDNRV